MKRYVKLPARKSSYEFEHVKAMFSKMTEAKLKEGELVCPQIKEHRKDNNFIKTLYPGILWICETFLGNKKCQDFRIEINFFYSLLQHCAVGCN